MQARFNIERDRENRLFMKSYKNDFCLFQFHSQLEIYIVEDGEMELFVDGKLAILSAGQISVALGYVPHAYKTPAASRSSVLLIPPHMCEEFIVASRGKRIVDPFITDPSVCEKIRHYYSLLKDPGISRVSRIGYIYVILGIIMENVKFEERDKQLDADLGSRILFYIDEKFKSGITPKSISSHFGYSQSYISRYFRSCFGITLCKYLTVVKLRSVIMLMHEGKYDVTYCALESGFSSMRTFYRSFQSEFGISPKEFIAQG